VNGENVSELEDVGRRLVAHARDLYSRGLVSGSGGNISARLSTGEVLASPSGHSLGSLDVSALALVDMDGVQKSGPRATKEVPLHLAAYRSSASVHAVVHTHSIYATSYSALAQPGQLLPVYTPSFAAKVGDVEITPFEVPGTELLARQVQHGLRGGRVATVLGNHGVVTVGATLDDAANRAFEVEENLKIYFLSSARARTLDDATQQAVKSLYG